MQQTVWQVCSSKHCSWIKNWSFFVLAWHGLYYYEV